MTHKSPAWATRALDAYDAAALEQERQQEIRQPPERRPVAEPVKAPAPVQHDDPPALLVVLALAAAGWGALVWVWLSGGAA